MFNSSAKIQPIDQKHFQTNQLFTQSLHLHHQHSIPSQVDIWHSSGPLATNYRQFLIPRFSNTMSSHRKKSSLNSSDFLHQSILSILSCYQNCTEERKRKRTTTSTGPRQRRDESPRTWSWPDTLRDILSRVRWFFRRPNPSPILLHDNDESLRLMARTIVSNYLPLTIWRWMFFFNVAAAGC